MSPGAVLQWVPVVREVVDLVMMAVEAGRKRRARRRRKADAAKAKGKAPPC